MKRSAGAAQVRRGVTVQSVRVKRHEADRDCKEWQGRTHLCSLGRWRRRSRLRSTEMVRFRQPKGPAAISICRRTFEQVHPYPAVQPISCSTRNWAGSSASFPKLMVAAAHISVIRSDGKLALHGSDQTFLFHLRILRKFFRRWRTPSQT